MPQQRHSSSISSRSSSPRSNLSSLSEIARLKRLLATAETELEQVKSGHKRKRVITTVTTGRGIRRLVTLFESIQKVVQEADRRYQEEQEQEQRPRPHTVDELTRQRNQDRTYQSYALLNRLLPDFEERLLESHDEGSHNYFLELQRGANEARSDDNHRIRNALPDWIEALYHPVTYFKRKSRSDRGLNNDVTGRLLCPITYDWDDPIVRSNIEKNRPGFQIANNFFSACFYPKDNFDKNDLEDGYLCSELLVKVFQCIFTSPTSAEDLESDDSDQDPPVKRRRIQSEKQPTRGNVASILNMEGKVTGRSIAYTAVMLHFNLTDAKNWTNMYNNFSYISLWNFIVDYFENAPNAAIRAHVDELLQWWNDQVFPDHVDVLSDSHESQDLLDAQRRAKSGKL